MSTKKKVTVQAIHKALAEIQQKLKAPKGQLNKFGNFNYRSCEDILEAVKPLLGKGLILILSDKMVVVGERYYVKATAKLFDGKEEIKVSAFARESLDKKGMDDAQITGSTSSYARKYALNGLFAIDDTKDDDVPSVRKVNAEKLLTGKELKSIATVLQDINNAKTDVRLQKVGNMIKLGIAAKKYTPNQAKVLRVAYNGKKAKLSKSK